ncbi:ABC transporter permease [Pseudochryseolinea flava]|nr:FtsX-like permease family protein [Pseudochryseolinea flava]
MVENMAISDAFITGTMAADASLTWEGKDPSSQPLIAMNSCSHDFPETNGFKFIVGRDFSRDQRTDSAAVIINALGAKLVGNGDMNVVGKKIRFGHGKEREIIGVIEDQVRWTPFANQSAHIYYINYDVRHALTIRLMPNMDVRASLKKIEAVLKQFNPGSPFEYVFQDQDYKKFFHDEERTIKLATVISSITIFISCIGVFGLAAYATSQRAKEIGIRKVLGASVFSIWRMLSTDFVKLVVIAMLIAMPLGYYVVTKWISQYDYRVDIEWIVFLFIALIAIAVTLLTVSYQTIKAALVNPTDSLRGE